ncbi:hypothetical protein TNCV_2569821 [Trichonephila clavipes]|nr:hypothetical protein TNCV_2569821 [Trichonephila clavipes]
MAASKSFVFQTTINPGAMEFVSQKSSIPMGSGSHPLNITAMNQWANIKVPKMIYDRLPSGIVSHGTNASRRPGLNPLKAAVPKLSGINANCLMLEPCANIRVMAQGRAD